MIYDNYKNRQIIPTSLFKSVGGNVSCAIITIFLFLFPQMAFSDKLLIMVTDKNCPYCQAWEREVGSVYPNTTLSIEYRLVRVELKRPLSKFNSLTKSVHGTPTFILINNGLEIGRIEGFSDAEMFWWLLDDIVDQAKNTAE